MAISLSANCAYPEPQVEEEGCEPGWKYPEQTLGKFPVVGNEAFFKREAREFQHKDSLCQTVWQESRQEPSRQDKLPGSDNQGL